MQCLFRHDSNNLEVLTAVYLEFSLPSDWEESTEVEACTNGAAIQGTAVDCTHHGQSRGAQG